ncbi:GTP cyclohydrolase II [Coemansia sp. RSA 552]|nr:GTP cyclohydrolase II [Coemansia sp. RSA 552]
MPSPSPVDPDSATVVPSTPVEKTSMTPVPKPTSVEAHFNASLDVALHILEKKKRQGGSETPVSWTPTSGSGELALPTVKDCRAAYAATPDDLITEAPTCCNSRASSEALGGLQKAAAQVHGESDDASPAAASIEATCQVRARIPYPGGHFYLHVYHTNEDDKEHLAIVFGDDLRSATLEEPRGGETDMDRRVRGASTGALRNLVGRDISRRKAGLPGSDGDGDAGDQIRGFEPDPAEAFAATRVSVVDAPLVRIHSECFTGETVSSVRCDCGYQLAEAMRLIQQEGRGVIVYLRQEGRGIGLLEKLKAYNIQDMGHDTVDANLLLNHPADARTYGAAQAILADLGISKLRLLTNNTDKIRQLRGNGHSDLDIVCHVPMYPRWWSEGADAAHLSYSRHLALKREVMSEADRYLRTKAERMGHMLSFDEPFAQAIIAPHVPATALYAQKP